MFWVCYKPIKKITGEAPHPHPRLRAAPEANLLEQEARGQGLQEVQEGHGSPQRGGQEVLGRGVQAVAQDHPDFDRKEIEWHYGNTLRSFFKCKQKSRMFNALVEFVFV